MRAVALGSTDGLVRGAEVIDTGKPIAVPVGKETLGRVFNLTGDQSGLDKPSYQGAELAVKLANARGGLLGGKVGP